MSPELLILLLILAIAGAVAAILYHRAARRRQRLPGADLGQGDIQWVRQESTPSAPPEQSSYAVMTWQFISVAGDFTAEHHLPEVLPVPPADEQRARKGDFTFEEAIQWMRRFVEFNAGHELAAQFHLAVRKADFYRELAEQMGRGRWNEVDDLARKLAELDPLDPSAALARGRAMRQLGHLASAVQFYQQALKLRPTHSLALPEFAATCRAMRQPHRFEDALTAAKQELGETHPLTIESRVQLGELVRVFADPVDPATVAHIPRQQYIQNIRMRLEESDPDVHTALAMGASMLNDDLPELAEMVIERCESTYGRRAELQVLRGMVQRHEHDLAGSEQTLRSALAEEDSAVGRLELARTLLERVRQSNRPTQRKGLLEQAEQELRLAIDRDPDVLEAVGLLANPLVDRPADEVADILTPLTRAYPAAWTPWKVIGDAYFTDERYEEALEAYEMGLARHRTDALLLSQLAVLEELEQSERLVKAAVRIDRLDERDPMLRWRVAQVLFEQGRMKEARPILHRLVDDETVAPPLRQRAREVLRHLESAPDEVENKPLSE